MGCFGCLFEILFLPFEFIAEFIINGYVSLMQQIIPERHTGKLARSLLKAIVAIFSAVLFSVFLIGILIAAFTEATVMNLWKLIFIPLGISLVQIILGIILRIVTRKK